MKKLPILETKLVQRRSKEEREKNHIIAVNKQIQEYIKNKEVGDLDISNSPIRELPNGLKVNSLDISGCRNLYSLPDDLLVNSLGMQDTNINDISNIKPPNYIFAKNSLIKSIPKSVYNLVNISDCISVKISKGTEIYKLYSGHTILDLEDDIIIHNVTGRLILNKIPNNLNLTWTMPHNNNMLPKVSGEWLDLDDFDELIKQNNGILNIKTLEL